MNPLGPALRVLDTVLDAHTLVLSRFILDEVQRVLLYPRIQARYRITADEIVRFTGNLAEVAHLVEPTIAKPLVEFDPDDDPVLYTAAEGQADILCTRNIRHFGSPVVKRFCDEHGIRAMTDVDAIRELFPEPGPR
jgi:putative PIN family toxin of toxin-antitoxin system